MVRKYLKATFLGLFWFVVAYLFVVFIWANSVVEEKLRETPSVSRVVPLPARQLEALIRIEDPAFHQHRGLDISHGQGVTTLTSVVARDLFLGSHKSDGIQGAMQSFYRGVFDCCKRIDFGRDVMSLVLGAHTTKQQQLNLYINGTYFGSLDGKAVIGFEAAAVAYYEKALADLTDQEFYGLMAMPMAPNYYHPLKNPDLHADRMKRIEALANGRCKPSGWLDLTYEACAAIN